MNNNGVIKARTKMTTRDKSTMIILRLTTLAITIFVTVGYGIASEDPATNVSSVFGSPRLIPTSPDSYNIQDEFIPVRPDIAKSFLQPVQINLASEAKGSAQRPDGAKASPNLEKTEKDLQQKPPVQGKVETTNTQKDKNQQGESKKPPALNDLIKKATELKASGDQKKALATLEEAAGIASNSHDKKAEAIILRSAADLAREIGSHEVALNYINKAIEINKAQKNARGRSLDLIVAGKIHQDRQHFPEALASFEEALKLLPVSEQSETPIILGNLSDILIKLQRYQEALNSLNKLGAYYSKSNNFWNGEWNYGKTTHTNTFESLRLPRVGSIGIRHCRDSQADRGPSGGADSHADTGGTLQRQSQCTRGQEIDGAVRDPHP